MIGSKMKWMTPINNMDAIQLRILDEITENNEVTHWVSGYAGSWNLKE